MKKRRQISFFFFSILVIFGVAIVGWFNLGNRNVKAAWFDDNWGYRKAITVTVTSSASDLANLETLLTIDTTGITAKLQTNCQDLRFTNQNGKSLPYFIDTCSDNSATNKVWVMVDLVPKNTTTYTMYMYYGNPTALSASDSVTFWRVNGLYGYWKMNESSWTIDCSTSSVKDSSAKGYNGKSCPTSTGPAGGATGQYGNAGLFDGSNDYVATSDITELNSASALTMSVWFKRRAAGSIIEVSKFLNSSNYINFEPWNDGQVYITFNNAGSATDAHFASNDTSWHHVVVVYDGSLGAGSRVLMFLDGVSQSLTLTGTIPATTPNMSGGTFEIGRSQQGSTYGDGTIDEVRLYNRVFSASEVANLYTSPGTTATISDSTSTPSTSFATEEVGSGPIGYWRFDEGRGSTTNDSTTNGNAGTITSATWQTEDLCVSGKCLYFDGTTPSKVSMGNATSLQLSGDMTLSAWIKPLAIDSSIHGIISKYYNTAGNRGYRFGITNSTGTLSFAVSNDGTAAGTGTSRSAVQANVWTHVAAVYHASAGSVEIYINGRLDVTRYGLPTSVYNTTKAFQVGIWDTDTAGNSFAGSIDEPQVYNFARTAAQIKADYLSPGINEGASTKLGADSRTKLGSLSNGLVGYWKLDESSGIRADSSGLGYTLSDWNTVTSNPGKFSRAGQYTRANSESLYVADNANLSVTGDYTISGWFYQDSVTTGDRCIICKGDVINSKREFYVIRGSGGVLAFYLATDGSTMTNVNSSEFSNTANVWNFVVAWYDSSKQTINIQVNGGKVDSIGFSATPFETDSQFMIGGVGNTAGTVLSFFDGRIDDVRVYKRVLNESERQLLYNFAPGPIGYWNFEEGTGGTAFDISGSGGDGTITAGAGGFTQGKFGKAYNFDAALTKIDAGSAAVLDDMTAFTAEAWIYPKSVGETAGRIFDKENSGLSNGWQYSVNTTTTMLFYRNYNSGANAISCSAPILGLNKWQHVAIAWNGTESCSGVTFYLNGVKQTTTTGASPSGSYDTDVANSLIIGNGTNQTRTFDGYIDEAKIYNYARNSKQINEDMNAGHPAGGSPVGSQVGYWKFNEGQGTTAYDSTPNGSNLTLTGMSSPASVGISGWNPNGKYGKALSFDGSNDKAAVTTNTALSITGQLTISAWIKMQSTAISERVFISKWNSTGNQRGMALSIEGSDQVCLGIDSDGAAGGIDTGCGKTALVKNTWYHVVAVYTPSTSIKIYLNGRLDGSLETGVDSAIFANTADFQVGGSVSGWSGLFTGDIDEVKVYNYALTPADILIDYNQGQGIVFGSLGVSRLDGNTASNSAASAYCVPGDSTSCDSPIAEWRFEERQGTSAFDTSGNGNTGTLTNGPVWSKGNFGSGLYFDSGSSQYVEDAAIATSITADVSAGAWFSTTSSQPDTLGRIIDIGVCGLQIAMDSSGVVQVDNSGGPTGSILSLRSGYNDGNWHFVEVTRSGTTYKLYIDGVYQGTAGGTAPTYTKIRVGGLGVSDCGAKRFFTGIIDNVVVYNYARSAAQIAWDYNRGLPMAWWKMDECQGTVVHDSISTFSGTLSVGAGGTQTSVGTCATSATTPWYGGRSGKYGSSINFDGTDDVVGLGNNFENITGGPSANFTLSVWVKPASTMTGNGILEKLADSNCSANLREWSVSLSTGSKPRFQWYSTDQNSRRAVLGSTPITDTSSWYHILVTYDGSVSTNDGQDRVEIYVNGVKNATTLSASSGTLSDIGYNTAHVGIGNLLDGTGAVCGSGLGFVGQIDDFKVWNYKLNNYQVKLEYNQSAAVRFGPTSGTP